MIKAVGRVTRASGQYAWVSVNKTVDCTTCIDKQSKPLSGFRMRPNTPLQVVNSHHAQVGDVVVIGSPIRYKLYSALATYLLPVWVMCFGIVCGWWLSSNMTNDAMIVAFGLLGLVAGFLGAGHYLRHDAAHSQAAVMLERQSETTLMQS